MTTASNRTPPGPGFIRLAAGVSSIAKDPMTFLSRMFEEYGDTVLLDGKVRRYYAVRHPDAVKYVLQTNQKNYGKLTALEALMDDGLSVSEGPAWQQQRRKMQAAFDHSSLEAIAKVVTDAASEVSDRWALLAESGEEIDVSGEMIKLALQVVGTAMFGTRLDADAKVLGESLDEMQTFLQRGFLLPSWLFPSKKKRFEQAVAAIDAIVYRIIEERRRGVRRNDLLQMLLADDERDDRRVRDNVMVMLIGGYETTAMALTWAWWLLSQHPQAEAQLNEELQHVSPTYASLPKLQYTRMVLDETMRLYPPGWAIPRRVREDDEVGGFKVRAGSTLLLAVHATHRHPDFWERPDEFDPSRFSPERSATRPAHAHIPFGGGPRKCPGYAFAMLEMTLVLATLAQRFHVKVIDEGPVEAEPLLVLRPKQKLKAKLKMKTPAALLT